jgi:apolipoprotein N-acyltransferase
VTPDTSQAALAGQQRGSGRGMSRIGSFEALVVRHPAKSLLAAGAVATLAMPPLFVWPVLIAVFFVVVRVLDDVCARSKHGRQRLWRCARVGWLFGFGYFVVGLYWISASLFVDAGSFAWLLPFSATLIPAGLAAFWAVAIGLAGFFWRSAPTRILLLATTLAMAEWLRGHLFTGLPWNTLGYALTAPPHFLQSASIFGVYGLTFWTVLLLGLPSMLSGARTTRWSTGICLGVPAVALALLAVWGAMQEASGPQGTVPGIRLRIVQPNVEQSFKWAPEQRRAIFDGLIASSRRGASGQTDDLKDITHVIWPESSIPFLLLQNPSALDAVGRLLAGRAHLVTGAIRIDEAAGTEPKIFNSILALDGDARLVASYDKVHLVPFGEYLPFQSTMERLGFEQLTRQRGGFAAGRREDRRLAVPGLPRLAPLICYEAIFPDEVRPVGDRPQLLFNVTNDAWFGRTAGPHQHFHQARVRAVEQGLPLVRAANTGISGVIDGRGRVLAQLKLGTAGVIDASIPLAHAETVYSRIGDWALAVMVIFTLIGLALTTDRWSSTPELRSGASRL